MIPLQDVIARLRRNFAALPEEKLEVVKHHMEEGAELARSFIGDENALGWAPLTDATIKDKDAQGYATPAPLLRDGDLRDSYVGQAESVDAEIKGFIGSTSALSVFHELGTSRMPERPVSPASMTQTEPKLLHALSELAARTLTVRH